jgi:hypothetical protein
MMANAKSEDHPIAVVGSGHAGMAALINTLVDIAYNTPDGAPPAKVVLFDTKDEAKPKDDTAYPLDGSSPMDLHPFYSDKLPVGFPTFGQYIEQMSEADPSLRSALLTPTYRQVNEYMEYVLELAVLSFSEQFLLEVNKTGIQDIQQTTPTGPATITFTDGTRLSVKRVSRGRRPPHMAGPQPKGPAATPTRREDRVLHASRLRLRDYLVIVAGKLTFSRPGETGPPPTWLFLADHKPNLDALPAERDFVDVPYVTAAGYFDPPHIGPAISYLEVLAKQAGVLHQIGSQKVVDGLGDQGAFGLFVHAANMARDQKGTDYARGLIGRLHEHRWAPGSRLTGFLLIQADGGLGRHFYDRANDATFLTARINDLRARIDRAKSEVTNLTDWTEALYRLSPEVQELIAYLERSEVEKTKDWHGYFARIGEDIMSIHRLNVNTATRRFLGLAAAPTWITTHLTDIRSGKSAAEYRQRLDHLYQERVAIPKYWHEAAVSLYNTPAESIPGALTDIDPYRAVSIDVLESWSLQLWNAFHARIDGKA